MIVMCDVVNCPYNTQQLCSIGALGINNSGQCKHLLKKNWAKHVDQENKEQLNILNIVKKEEQ